jgi:hypothetical protein
MDLYIRFPIRLLGVVFSQVSRGTTLSYMTAETYSMGKGLLHNNVQNSPWEYLQFIKHNFGLFIIKYVRRFAKYVKIINL